MNKSIPPSVAGITEFCDDPDTSSRYQAISGVHVTIEGDNYRMAATDGRVLVIAEGTLCDPEPGDPDIVNADPKAEAIVNAKMLDFAFSLADAIGSLRGIVVAPGGATTTLACGDGGLMRVDAPNVEGKFPNWQAIMPTKPPVVSMRIDPTSLVKILEYAVKCDHDYQGVVIEIHKSGDTDPGKLVVKADAKGESVYALMTGMWEGAK